MKILVLGAGKMGYGLLTDISAQSDISEVVAADIDLKQAKRLAERIGSDKLEETRKVDVTNYPETIKLMREGLDGINKREGCLVQDAYYEICQINQTVADGREGPLVCGQRTTDGKEGNQNIARFHDHG